MAIKNTKVLFVGGKYDDNGGRSSKIANLVASELGAWNTTIFNGGHFSKLEKIVDSINNYDLIYWFADVPNDKPKLVRQIKKQNKACVLVTSKNNVGDRYSFQDLLYRSFETKSNLVLEISNFDGRYHGRILDPLGNVFLDHHEDMQNVGRSLHARATELLEYTRVPSICGGPPLSVPDESRFFDIVSDYAHKMHELVHARPEAVNRFFGNASFSKDGLFVTRRNVDKRSINKVSFVGVTGSLPLRYFGEKKPSVDAPTQVLLYNHYPKVRYMLHTHAYIEGAPFTSDVVPCRALEEVDEIKRLYPDSSNTDFHVNLMGHGSLALVSNVSALEEIPYIERHLPEIQEMRK